ncbi:MAG TPA: hypothetical protein VN719_03600 [Gemmatimonadales bacterium]|nr:hypothetical protein [Gemmatimonadales bacterium]
MTPPSPLLRKLVTALVMLGVALRVWAYAGNPPLWLDETLVARNIFGLSLGELLTEPLKLDQVAPRGFLLVEKLAVLAFGRNELSLRLFPFLSSIAGIFLFRSLAERALAGWAVPFAVGLFAIGIPFIKHAAEVKQYELDPTAAVCLTLLTIRLRERDSTSGGLLLAGLAGFAITWFSQPSVIVLGGIGLALAVEWGITREQRTARLLLITVPIWAAASVIAIWAGLGSMTPSTRAFMHDFWAGGFLPRPRSLLTTATWLWDQGLSVFTDPTMLRFRWPAVFLIIAPIGLLAIGRRRRDIALLLAGPVVVAILAALLQQYPFRGRLMLYLIPSLLLAIAAAVERIRRWGSAVHPGLGGALMVALAVPPVDALVKAPPPYDIEHTPALLAYLHQHRQPGDVVYVFPLSRINVLFYGPRLGVQPGDWTTGICNRDDTRAFVRDADRYRGTRRLWVISSGVRPYRSARAAVRNYLSTIGVKRDSLIFPSLTWKDASLELYDLSDPVRLAAADPETFPVQPMPTDPRPGCRPWAQPSPLDSLN